MDKEYLVLYTHQKTKKTKTWQDGVLKVCRAGSKAVLFSDSGSKVDSVHVKTNQLNIGDEIESDRHLITIEEIKVNGEQERKPVKNEVKSSDGLDNSDIRYGINPVVSQPERLNVNSAAVSRPLKTGLKRKRTEFIPPRLVKQQVLHSGINSPTATEACRYQTNHHIAIPDEKSSFGTNIFNLHGDHEVFAKNKNVQIGPCDAECYNTEGNSNSVGSRAYNSPWSVIGQPRRPRLLESKEEGIRHEDTQSKKSLNSVSLPEKGKRSAAQILKLIGGKPFKPPLKQSVRSVLDDNIKEKIQEGEVNETARCHAKVHDNQYIALEGNDVTLSKTNHLLDDTVHCETSDKVQAVSETNDVAEKDAAVIATEDVSISKSKGVSVAIEDYDITEEDTMDGYFDINFSPLSQVSDSEPDSPCSSETFNSNKLSQAYNVLVAKPFPSSSSNSETLGNHGCPKTMSSTSKHEIYFKSNTEDTVFECENNVKVEITNQKTQFAKCSLRSTPDAEDTAVNKSASLVNFSTLEDLAFSPGPYVGSFSMPTGSPQQQLHVVGDSCIQNQTTLTPNQTLGCNNSILKQEFDDSPVSIQKNIGSFPPLQGYRLVENTFGDDLVPSVNLVSDADTEQTH
ncbi:uncharacterized protein LOC106162571, partial [Lingula anatina]|uniref:Uncharacterized protein LOC106162571 n=1 Tax=Lingula anatina TaxID=7574 RepID=A0A1S3IAP7_LINAN